MGSVFHSDIVACFFKKVALIRTPEYFLGLFFEKMLK